LADANFMNSGTAAVYRHSGKFGWHGPIVALAAAVGLGFPLGFAYAYLMKWIPFIILKFIGTLIYAFAFGLGTGAIMKWAKVRNNRLALVSGLTVGILALYFGWNAHLHTIFKGVPVLVSPGALWATIQQLYVHGTWGLRNSGPMTGVPLAIVWIAEAFIIVGFTALISRSMVAEIPFCEKNQCWLDQTKTISTLQPFTQPEHVAALRAGDLSPLAQAKPRAPDAQGFARLTLRYSPKSDQFCTVRVENVTMETLKDGETRERKEELTRDLIVPPATFDLLSRFENFSEPLSAAA
jgi:hypothetical protein